MIGWHEILQPLIVNSCSMNTSLLRIEPLAKGIGSLSLA
ncbi:hypothetical protein SJ05684_a38910 (plasmid) [Sinorhizobium sojae CCBAU 05684]|uniref:Uncharacterized protein n=2 Tax=Sinorhizobium TaxID=28105 RepID=I3XHA8_SINF2|nr:hypothetical protein USDA257_p05490 [Sinorhizobium fredii USDA 257]ASY60569.1 hypothetical protein SS05631_a41840 [Sinorhizobium sp. CCBAU 05631]ASY67205.1 hypothetical protein SJ05684_a38910 [Sinorhizobium sojae CCBAU 05684]ASY73603.1 hypothetical protein SF83666_a40150 [Sinorhizobium fredii CCBAU 83666]AWI61910.1 hypothetical protein AB395_00004385 [Sinorhizobium fredii CCBAU 45436]AWM29832.1 hypothetical protein AOX55_00004396 [Sinorhizobium fredii CCBAU 25509]CCE98969.1 hypothetical pr